MLRASSWKMTMDKSSLWSMNGYMGNRGKSSRSGAGNGGEWFRCGMQDQNCAATSQGEY